MPRCASGGMTSGCIAGDRSTLPQFQSLFPVHSSFTIETMTTPTHAQQLLSLLARTSFRLGQFKLSSGGTSDYYIDCRTTTLHAEGGRLTGAAILDLLEAKRHRSRSRRRTHHGRRPHRVQRRHRQRLARASTPPLRCCTASWSARPKRPMAPAAASRVLPRGSARGHCGRRLHHRRIHHQRH